MWWLGHGLQAAGSSAGAGTGTLCSPSSSRTWNQVMGERLSCREGGGRGDYNSWSCVLERKHKIQKKYLKNLPSTEEGLGEDGWI